MDFSHMTYEDALYLFDRSHLDDHNTFEMLFFLEAVETLREAKFDTQAFLKLSLEKFYLCFDPKYQYFLHLFMEREVCLSETKLLQILRAAISSARRASDNFFN